MLTIALARIKTTLSHVGGDDRIDRASQRDKTVIFAGWLYKICTRLVFWSF